MPKTVMTEEAGKVLPITPENLRGTKSEKNLTEAFLGEASAACKYGYFANIADEEGYGEIAGVFREASGRERVHARVWAEYLGSLSATGENLKHASELEHEAWAARYERFAKEADGEGFSLLASRFRAAARIAKENEAHFLSVMREISDCGCNVSGEQIWECKECGLRAKDIKAPENCPFCGVSRGAFHSTQGKQ